MYVTTAAHSRDRKNLQTPHHCIIVSILFIIYYLFLSVNAKMRMSLFVKG